VHPLCWFLPLLLLLPVLLAPLLLLLVLLSLAHPASSQLLEALHTHLVPLLLPLLPTTHSFLLLLLLLLLVPLVQLLPGWLLLVGMPMPLYPLVQQRQQQHRLCLLLPQLASAAAADVL
jgi:hypothetical protein